MFVGQVEDQMKLLQSSWSEILILDFVYRQVQEHWGTELLLVSVSVCVCVCEVKETFIIQYCIKMIFSLLCISSKKNKKKEKKKS